MYNVADFKINMNKTTIKRKQVSSTIESYKKCTKINKTFVFKICAKKISSNKLMIQNSVNLMLIILWWLKLTKNVKHE